MSHNLSKMLKFRLPVWKNKEFWKWCSSQRRDSFEHHHLLGRRYSDLFIVHIPAIDHRRIHTTGYKEGEFESLFIESLQNIMKFVDEKAK